MTLNSKYPLTHLISNGQYSVMADDSGSGFSAVNGEFSLTRWKEDPISGQYGTYIFIRDLASNKKPWSAAYHPTQVEPDTYEVNLTENKIIYRRSDNEILVQTEITISKEDNVELRRVTITNQSSTKRKLEITSFAEVALAHSRADSAHPAFAKMFVESEWDNQLEALVFARRPRSKHEEKLFLLHTTDKNSSVLEYESSRAEFIGRGNNISSPAIFQDISPLSKKVGSVLDPIFSLRTSLVIDSGKTESITFITAFSKDKIELKNLATSYKELSKIDNTFNRKDDLSNKSYQRLANTIFYNIQEVRGTKIEQNVLTQSSLWRFGVSGDLPIVLLRVAQTIHTELTQELVQAHEYLKNHGLIFDLVIIGPQINHQLLNQRGGIHVPENLSEQEKILLDTIARAVFDSSNGSLADQLNFDRELINLPKESKPTKTSSYKINKTNYEFFNGLGGFIDDGDGYQIEVNDLAPQPWSNIIANPEFGFIVTDSGGGYTWSENSRENRLTPWYNDPISDPSGEVIYIKEKDSVWCPTPRPIVSECVVKHCLGYSEFIRQENGIESCLNISGAKTDKVKWWSLKLTNLSTEQRQLEVYLYLEWVLGVLREDNNRHLVSNFDLESSILYAKNNFNHEFAGRIVYLGSNKTISAFTTCREEFIGRQHNTSTPKALNTNNKLSGKTGSGFDSCAVLKVEQTLEPKQQHEILFYISEALTLDQAKRDASRFKSSHVRAQELQNVTSTWKSTLSKVQVKTPDRAFDIMLNTWLLYQTLTCRLYARSAYYQSGGAIGFRDQLQDVMALLYCMPELARKQILLHASRQFIEGDVQHWWHPPGGKGVRTRISDDYLWLPYVTYRYIEVTGDREILKEVVPYLDGSKLRTDQMEDYMMPFVSDKSGSIYEHCVLALKHAFTFGENGFPLMGCGDWNDGMNEVGRNGKGESVWLAWFLSDCLYKFKDIATEIGDQSNAKLFEEKSKQLINSIDKNAWDGNWYLRAFFDDGTPMGSHKSSECKIDSLSQSWSVIVGRGNKERSAQAMNAIRKELVKKDDKIICLLTPPFYNSELEPGYIKGYLQGIRENGGQYTHAAAWVIMATAIEGKGKEAVELFSMINPINHTLDRTGIERYKTEPYVLCGDVYSNPQLRGHGGWSWYTGSAAWMYQVGIEYIIGLKISGDSFTVNPCIDPSWKEFSISLNLDGKMISIQVDNPDGVQTGVKTIEVNGKVVSDLKLKLSQVQEVKILMG